VRNLRFGYPKREIGRTVWADNWRQRRQRTGAKLEAPTVGQDAERGIRASSPETRGAASPFVSLTAAPQSKQWIIVRLDAHSLRR